jgi:hypothetical protein
MAFVRRFCYAVSMETSFNNPVLPPEIEAAVVRQHGGPVPVSGQQGKHVVMSAAIFRDMMGVGDDEDFEKSVADLQISLAQEAAGQTISLSEAQRRLAEKYGG